VGSALNCMCGHPRDQHGRILSICKAPVAYAALTGASPLTGRVCLCVRYRPVVPGRLARFFRKLTQH
jgi:hypothetical protein